jgi:hypothetical protein
MVKNQENISISKKLRGLNSKAFTSGSGELKEKLDTTMQNIRKLANIEC